MRFRRPLSALTVYLAMQASNALFFSLIFTAQLVYYVERVRPDPLQMVLVGTILEGTVFLCEIPTGLLADLKSRRLSIIVGYALMGLGFFVEGAVPTFGAVAATQVLWGLGYTFTSGATQAWVADELGEERVGSAYLRAAQARQPARVVGILGAMALGSLASNLPILLGGGLLMALAGWMALAMPEEGFHPAPHKGAALRSLNTALAEMGRTARDAATLVRAQAVLGLILAIGLFYGLYSEGYDRLWNLHLLRDIGLPAWAGFSPMVWMGLIALGGVGASLAATEWARRRVDTTRDAHLTRALALGAVGIIAGLTSFGLARRFWLALPLIWAVGGLRALTGPLQDAWLNRQITDSQVRATLFSVGGQADAIGQVVAGPAMGLIGKYLSAGAALVASALLLSPVLPLYARAARLRRWQPVPPDAPRY